MLARGNSNASAESINADLQALESIEALWERLQPRRGWRRPHRLSRLKPLPQPRCRMRDVACRSGSQVLAVR
jgi:hypothetical protein